MTPQTKQPTPLSTRALAAYLTWKQLDALTLLHEHGTLTTAELADMLEEIVAYDRKHGGAFYKGISTHATLASLRVLENRRLVARHDAQRPMEWTTTARAEDVLDWLLSTPLYAA